MKVLTARSAEEGLYLGLNLLRAEGVHVGSRNGSTIEYPGPVTTVFKRPERRVVFHPARRANPFFHLFESLWMLGGRNDVEYLTQFVKTMVNYSDDGKTFNGAYGHRWRTYFGRDQLNDIIHQLRWPDPLSRRAVLAMWDGARDGVGVSKDFPCNLSCVFSVRPGRATNHLHMTVFNRSNDIILGLYGANVVHFSILQEYVAGCLGLPMGTYTHVSNSFHAYPNWDRFLKLYEGTTAERELVAVNGYVNEYEVPGAPPTFPIMSTPKAIWDIDLTMFLSHPDSNSFQDPFFTRIAKPMWFAHKALKAGDRKAAEEILWSQMPPCDWRVAALSMINRWGDPAPIK